MTIQIFAIHKKKTGEHRIIFILSCLPERIIWLFYCFVIFITCFHALQYMFHRTCEYVVWLTHLSNYGFVSSIMYLIYCRKMSYNEYFYCSLISGLNIKTIEYSWNSPNFQLNFMLSRCLQIKVCSFERSDRNYIRKPEKKLIIPNGIE